MSKLFDHPDLNERQLRAQIDPLLGAPTFRLNLTLSCYSDTVDCVIPTLNVLPIIFVPGIMGSNLRSIKAEYEDSEPVWRLDSGGGALFSKVFKNAGKRQKLLHPGRTEVDDQGDVPDRPVGILSKPEQFRARYWGEVSSISYQEFLIWLEDQLNGATNQVSDGKAQVNANHSTLNAVLQQMQDGKKQWRAKKDFSPLTAEEGKKAVEWYYPVYAFGYNWLSDNTLSAKELVKRINQVIQDNKRQFSLCEQVILVTHSMGGLVARACSMLPGMEKKIAGIVHGVMPAAGAAVAYRRCKVGMKDEGPTALKKQEAESWTGHLTKVGMSSGGAATIGNTGPEITAVFAQAPGALQLLPTKQYPEPNWLQICDTDGSPLPGEQPKTDDPYGEGGVYTERTKWWGLIQEKWLEPDGGKPITWDTYLQTLKLASDFHGKIQDYHHPNTWGFYGSKVDSFAQVRWTLIPFAGDKYALHPKSEITKLSHADVPLRGVNPEILPGKPVMLPPRERAPADFSSRKPESVLVPTTSHTLRLSTAKDSGDGTVPAGSGLWPASPLRSGEVQQCIKQFFEVQGIEHEPAYKNKVTQHITVYAIGKIAAKAALPKRV